MAYESYNVQRQYFPQTPKEFWVETFQQFHKANFSNASDVLTIEKYNTATKTYSNILTRVNHISTAKPSGQSSTATNNYDDYREIIFSDYTTVAKVGDRYKFWGFTWLTVTSDDVNQITKSCVVRRCNNTLKWYDSNGVYNEEPCVILDKLDDSGNSFGSNTVLSNGAISILVQATDNVKLIKENRRFLFGGQAFKVESIKNFIYDLYTIDLTRVQVLDGVDDIVNNIAERGRYGWTLNILESSLSITTGNTAQLTTQQTLNGETSVKPVRYISSNPLIATVNSSGVVTAIASGTVTITCSFVDENISDTTTINVVTTPIDNIVVVVSPLINTLLQGNEQTFTVQKLNNTIIQPDTFNVNVTAGIVDSYSLTIIDGNTFKIKNLKYYANNNITVLVTSVIDGSNKSFTFKLGGAW